ncbi:FkbM family methyltransferase [Chlamydiota bacterium]
MFLRKCSFLKDSYNKIVSITLPNKDLIVISNELKYLVRNPRKSLIGRSLYRKGVWEPELTSTVLSLVKPGMTIVDVGADIGYFTLLFAKCAGEGGQVFSFEPIPKAREYLERNIALNGFKNIRIESCALFDSERNIILEQPFNKSRVNPKKKIASSHDIRVITRIFDQWVEKRNIARIDAIKIDVEGAELNVLKGMKKSIQKYHPHFFIEIHPEYIKQFGYKTAEVIAFLNDYKYRIEPVNMPKIDFSKENCIVHCYKKQ